MGPLHFRRSDVQRAAHLRSPTGRPPSRRFSFVNLLGGRSELLGAFRGELDQTAHTEVFGSPAEVDLVALDSADVDKW